MASNDDCTNSETNPMDSTTPAANGSTVDSTQNGLNDVSRVTKHYERYYS